MPDTIQAGPILPMMAFQPSWAVFLPEAGATPSGQPPIEVKAGQLTDFLGLWSEIALKDLEALSSSEMETGDKPAATGKARAEHDLSLLLESLDHAAETLLAFRRRDYEIEIPESFCPIAQRLLIQAQARNLQVRDLTVLQIARKLSAALSHLEPTTRAVRVDGQGRVFEESSGMRRLEFDPARVLKARQEAQAGLTRPLAQIREAEARDRR